MDRNRWFAGIAIFGLVCFFGAEAFSATDRTIQNQLKLMSLQKAGISLQSSQDDLERDRNEYEDLRTMFTQDVVTGKEVNVAEAAMLNARNRRDLGCITLGETYLNFLQDSIQVAIETATKLIDADGNRFVEVTLRNSSNKGLARQGIPLVCPTLEGVLEYNEQWALEESRESACNRVHSDICRQDVGALMNIENIRVAIRIGTIVIGVPYELAIDRLPLGESQSRRFLLAQDADEVTVSMRYQDIEDVRNVRLESRSIDDVVRVTSMRFDQTGQLGEWVNFDLRLERLAEEKRVFMLEVFNLPAEFRARFTAGGSEVRLREFDKYNTVQDVGLRVFVPERIPETMLDEPIEFFAVVAAQDEMGDLIRSLAGRPITELDLIDAKIGYRRLLLTPRGTAELDISFRRLSHVITQGETAEIEMTVLNSGTADLTNIEFRVDLPLDWSRQIEPETVRRLEAGREAKVMIAAIPPSMADVGDYEVNVRANTVHEGTAVETARRNLRISIEGRSNVGGMTAMVLVLVVLLLGIAVFTIKLSRR